MNYDDNMKRRLRRVEGQVRGILKMMEEGKNCKDVVSHLSAVRNAVVKTLALVVAVNLEQCLLEEKEQGRDSRKLVQKAAELLIKSR